MSKNDEIKTLVKLLAKGLCHKIGGIVNLDALYSQKYLKEADTFFSVAKNISIKLNLNLSDKERIKVELVSALRRELENRTFLDEKKFNYINKEVDWALKMLKI